MYIHTYITYIHACMWVCPYIHILNILMHVYIHMYINSYMCVHTYTYLIHECQNTFVCIYRQTCMGTYKCVLVHNYTYYIYMCSYWWIHVHTYVICVCIYAIWVYTFMYVKWQTHMTLYIYANIAVCIYPCMCCWIEYSWLIQELFWVLVMFSGETLHCLIPMISSVMSSMTLPLLSKAI